MQLIRDHKVNYQSDYPLADNSGFVFVAEHGRYFKCDDIPKYIASGDYHNARIHDTLAQTYYEHKVMASATSSNNQALQVDEAWVKCWKSPQHDGTSTNLPDPASCYKSTIIIPMTLRNNTLAPLFLKRLGAETHERYSRTIFGYLCFDHVETHYFNDDIDIDVGYIFADIISRYMITRSIYTTLSTTYTHVMERLGDKQRAQTSSNQERLRHEYGSAPRRKLGLRVEILFTNTSIVVQ